MCLNNHSYRDCNHYSIKDIQISTFLLTDNMNIFVRQHLILIVILIYENKKLFKVFDNIVSPTLCQH